MYSKSAVCFLLLLTLGVSEMLAQNNQITIHRVALGSDSLHYRIISSPGDDIEQLQNPAYLVNFAHKILSNGRKLALNALVQFEFFRESKIINILNYPPQVINHQIEDMEPKLVIIPQSQPKMVHSCQNFIV